MAPLHLQMRPHTRPHPADFAARLVAPVAAMALAFALSGCIFGNSPEKLNQRIDAGEAAKALTTIEEKLISEPSDPALNLLAIKARLALCHIRNCTAESPGTTPALLGNLGKLAAYVEGPVQLGKKSEPITLQQIFQTAMEQYQSLQPQPAAVLTLYRATPSQFQPAVASGLFQPALVQARRAETTSAAAILTQLGNAENLPASYSYAANAMAATFTGQMSLRETNLIALRSATETVPPAAAAIVPWAILHRLTVSGTLPAETLGMLSTEIDNLKIGNILTSPTTAAIADELITTSTNPTTRKAWQRGWTGDDEGLKLAMQRTALSIDPNRPDVWSTYLPALVSATLLQSTSATQAVAANLALPASRITSESAPHIATQVINAANRLANYPDVATPLAMFASQLMLTNQQQIDLEKLSQSLLIKAAERGDVTSTLALARTLPGVAQNNRQSVVPLLVSFIRNNLRQGNFEAATNTAGLLTQTLQMDIEFEPLIIEEFEDDLKRRKIAEQLKADTTESLLKPQEEVTIDLGPMYSFMQVHFANQPKVLSSQLTTLVAESTGTYGQPTAMYRLGIYFPPDILPADKQRAWLGASLEQSLLADTTLSGPQLAKSAAELAPLHPELNLAPLLETAIKRTTALEDQRTLWHEATPQVREVLRAIRPEFTLLMQGIDAMASSQLNTAAQSFSGLTDATWRTEASPFIEQFHERLLTLSGIYVPVSGAPSLKTAALIIEPQGLAGGKLHTVSVTFISRAGSQTESETGTLRTNAMSTKRFTIAVPYNFDTRQLPITPQTVAQAPQGGMFNSTFGNIRNIGVQDGENTLLMVTLADGSKTPFVRTLLDPAQPLRPDGTFLLQNRVGTPDPATMPILPPSSMLTFETQATMQPRAPDSDAVSAYVVPLSGTLRHPASTQPISFTGYFEPDFLTTTFTFSYPLPKSTQPARATVRCQVLAGPITCGAHNLNAARQAYAAITTGLQTRESLATAAATRNSINSTASARLLLNAVPQITSSQVSQTGLLPPPSMLGASSLTLPLAVSSNTAPVSSTEVSTTAPAIISSSQPAAAAPAAAPAPEILPQTHTQPQTPTEDDEEELDEEEAPVPAKPLVNRFINPNEPEPGAFINNSGSKNVSTSMPKETAAPGTFINRSGGKATSPTTAQ